MEKGPQSPTATAQEKDFEEKITPDFRQQNKIIKIIESGDLEVINQPMAAVSAAERDSFLKKLGSGELTNEQLDGVIKSIGAPFSGKDGFQRLHETAQKDYGFAKSLSGVMRAPGDRYREGAIPSPEELEKFIREMPTPREFDARFVDGRIEQLEQAIADETQPGRKENLEAELKVERQKQSIELPKLKAALYGKRSEYWNQVKLLKQEGEKTLINEDPTPSPTKPPERAPAASQRTESVPVDKAENVPRKEPESATPTQLAELYKDLDEVRQQQTEAAANRSNSMDFFYSQKSSGLNMRRDAIFEEAQTDDAETRELVAQRKSLSKQKPPFYGRGDSTFENWENQMRELEEEITERRSGETQSGEKSAPVAKNEAIEKQEVAQLQKELSNTEESFSRLARIFQKRESNQLSPLLERGDAVNIMSGTRSLAEAIKGGKIDYEQIVQSLSLIRRGFENFGQYRNTGSVREDADSLAALSASLRDAGDIVQRLRGTLAESRTPEAQEAIAAIGGLSKTLEETWHQTARRREALSRYSR